jgi:hypothetical protein
MESSQVGICPRGSQIQTRDMGHEAYSYVQTSANSTTSNSILTFRLYTNDSRAFFSFSSHHMSNVLRFTTHQVQKNGVLIEDLLEFSIDGHGGGLLHSLSSCFLFRFAEYLNAGERLE